MLGCKEKAVNLIIELFTHFGDYIQKSEELHETALAMFEACMKSQESAIRFEAILGISTIGSQLPMAY